MFSLKGLTRIVSFGVTSSSFAKISHFKGIFSTAASMMKSQFVSIF